MTGSFADAPNDRLNHIHRITFTTISFSRSYSALVEREVTVSQHVDATIMTRSVFSPSLRARAYLVTVLSASHLFGTRHELERFLVSL